MACGVNCSAGKNSLACWQAPLMYTGSVCSEASTCKAEPLLLRAQADGLKLDWSACLDAQCATQGVYGSLV